MQLTQIYKVMKTSFLILALLVSIGAYAQSLGAISGNITDTEMNGEPLLFANIEVKGTQLAAQTNLNGNFEINDVVPGKYILAVGFPGYESLEISVKVKKNNTVKIQGKLSAKSIDVSSLLQAENVSKKKIAALVTSNLR